MTLRRRGFSVSIAFGVLAALSIAGCSSGTSKSSSSSTEPASGAIRNPDNRKDLVFFAAKASSPSTQTISFHLYDAGSNQPVASICIKVPDATVLVVPPTERGTYPDVYTGVTENTVACNDPALIRNESAGTPSPDQHYLAACQALTSDDAEMYHYPEDFTATTPPTCTHTN